MKRLFLPLTLTVLFYVGCEIHNHPEPPGYGYDYGYGYTVYEYNNCDPWNQPPSHSYVIECYGDCCTFVGGYNCDEVWCFVDNYCGWDHIEDVCYDYY